MESLFAFREGVELPLALGPDRDQFRSAKISKMPRDLGLNLIEDRAQVANANFALQQQIENPQPCRVREGPKEVR